MPHPDQAEIKFADDCDAAHKVINSGSAVHPEKRDSATGPKTLTRAPRQVGATKPGNDLALPG
jgi:hypothetical protein